VVFFWWGGEKVKRSLEGIQRNLTKKKKGEELVRLGKGKNLLQRNAMPNRRREETGLMKKKGGLCTPRWTIGRGGEGYSPPR